MSDVGLDYLTLGQPLSTLSGGECQRIKMASELHKKGNIYVLDEPTTGLHMSDTSHLLAMLDRLVDAGNTVIVIEHNLDVIRNADWIIDLGPEGGSKGGRIMFTGTPTDLLADPDSLTAEYLRRGSGSRPDLAAPRSPDQRTTSGGSGSDQSRNPSQTQPAPNSAHSAASGSSSNGSTSPTDVPVHHRRSVAPPAATTPHEPIARTIGLRRGKTSARIAAIDESVTPMPSSRAPGARPPTRIGVNVIPATVALITASPTLPNARTTVPTRAIRKPAVPSDPIRPRCRAWRASAPSAIGSTAPGSRRSTSAR